MKILFLNPPLSQDRRYGVLSQAGAAEPPLGLAYLAATTRESQVETSILDAAALGLGLEEVLKIVANEEPDLLAITLTTVSLKTSVFLAQKIKEMNSGIRILVGGPHLTSLPEDTMLASKAFDIGVIGEGEQTIKELLRAFKDNSPWTSIPGIAFKMNGKVIRTSCRMRIKHLDELPMPAFDLLPKLDRHYRVPTQSIKYMPCTSLVTSRGCPGKCAFCDRATFGNDVRFHSADYITEMMLRLQKDYGVKGVLFEDDNFMLSEERLHNFAELIKKKNIKIVWSALSRIDLITEAKLRLAKEAGCWQILCGVESGSQKILDFFKKGVTLKDIKAKIQLIQKHGFYTKGFFILGSPLETMETLRQTKEFIATLNLDDISLTFFTPYPGSEIWNEIHEYGKLEADWDKFSCFELVFIPTGLSKDQVVSAYREILSDFYSSPRVYWSYLKRLRSFSQARELYKSWRTVSAFIQRG